MQSNLYSEEPLFSYWNEFDGVPANFNPAPPQPPAPPLAVSMVGTQYDNGSYSFVPPPAGMPMPLGPMHGPGPGPNPMMGPVHRNFPRYPPPLAPLQTMSPHVPPQLQPPPPPVVVSPTHPFNFQSPQQQFPVGVPAPVPVQVPVSIPVPLPVVEPSLERTQLNDSGQMEQVVVKNGQVFHISFLDEPEEPQPPAQPTPTSEEADDEERDWINYDELPLLKHVTGSSNGDGTYKCGICGKELKSALNLYVHEQTHKTTRLDCKICGKRFNRIGKLEHHMRRQHPEATPDRVASPKTSSSTTPVMNDFNNYCVECEEFFASADELQNHMEQNHRLINDSKSSMDSGEKKSIKCPYCEEAFEWPCLLKTHMTKHTGEKPFICERCNVSFRFVQSFYRHNRRVHGK